MSFARSSALLAMFVGSWSVSNPAGGQLVVDAIDIGRSSAKFVVHMRINMRAEGQFTRVTGELRGSPDSGWKVLVDVDGQSLRFDGPQWMERITRSEAFLALDRFPEIGFKSENFTDLTLRAGGPLRGDLTLRGHTRPVSFKLLPSSCARPGRGCDIQVEGTISRHDFGMNAHRILVKDDVDFQIRVRLNADTPKP